MAKMESNLGMPGCPRLTSCCDRLAGLRGRPGLGWKTVVVAILHLTPEAGARVGGGGERNPTLLELEHSGDSSPLGQPETDTHSNVWKRLLTAIAEPAPACGF